MWNVSSSTEEEKLGIVKEKRTSGSWLPPRIYYSLNAYITWFVTAYPHTQVRKYFQPSQKLMYVTQRVCCEVESLLKIKALCTNVPSLYKTTFFYNSVRRKSCRLSLWGVTTWRGFCTLHQTTVIWTTRPEKEHPACMIPFRCEHLKCSTSVGRKITHQQYNSLQELPPDFASLSAGFYIIHCAKVNQSYLYTGVWGTWRESKYNPFGSY